VSLTPGLSKLFLDFSSSVPAARAFYGSLPADNPSLSRPELPAHWLELVRLLTEQNPEPGAAPALAALGNGAGVTVTGQQVGLFGGPLFTPFKAATAIARARNATSAGSPHVAVFWLATEDHDFAEINNVQFPAGRELVKLTYENAPAAPVPVGGIVLDESIGPLAERAAELIGPSETTDALVAAYKPGRTFAQAFADFYRSVFAAQGLLLLDASSRKLHRLGAPVLRAAIERADEFHSALTERNSALEAAGYHAQVVVAPGSSLVFLIDESTGARVALKRTAPTAAEPNGLWTAGKQSYTTDELVGVLDAQPERISPNALLRPVFQDFLLSSSLFIGGPSEIAYLAQSAVLYERILGRQTPLDSRLSATLIEPAVAKLLRKHELTLDRIYGEDAASLAQVLAARSMPIETKQKLAAAGNALDAELSVLVDWLKGQDAGTGNSAETAASKMLYQMNRLRTMAANLQLQRETTLAKHAEIVTTAIFPGGPQERMHGAAYCLARYGAHLVETLTTQAADSCPGHLAIWL
jgi:bacillithiol biosynthesis cysteine-adding enzyme BshC